MKIKRQTVQKIKIMEYMKSTKSHPTAEAVHAEVSKELPMISLSTVYRNLNTMVEDEELLKLDFGNEAHYDADTSFHHHAYCLSCREIFDVFDDNITDFFNENVEIDNFNIEQTMIIFYGNCKNCKNVNDKANCNKVNYKYNK
ncbi:MAG: transcriptional repressor [Methanosarcinaceae archaeon]|nr:transcriptional repressor [Methanosarcinaceae archaeon]